MSVYSKLLGQFWLTFFCFCFSNILPTRNGNLLLSKICNMIWKQPSSSVSESWQITGDKQRQRYHYLNTLLAGQSIWNLSRYKFFNFYLIFIVFLHDLSLEMKKKDTPSIFCIITVFLINGANKWETFFHLILFLESNNSCEQTEVKYTIVIHIILSGDANFTQVSCFCYFP